MALVRHSAVAGTFYPASARALHAAVRGFLEASTPPDLPAPKALIVPHAGYAYSGSVAGTAYALLASHGTAISRVVLLGPAHRVRFRGLALSGTAFFETPLGPVETDPYARLAVADLPQVSEYEAPFVGEHCLEVQLPFLQQVLKDFRIAPFLVGSASADEVTEVIERLWGGPETLVLVSSDLSHFLPYERALAVDAATTRAIEELRPGKIGPDQACGRIAIAGLLRAARRHGLRAVTLDLRNSGDTAGSRDRVVGYGAWALVPDAP